MNAFVKKEIRLLLPSFSICCLLSLANLFFRFQSDDSFIVLVVLCCAVTAMMLALNSFGAEISSGIFSNLLAQPVSRQKIWDTKILLLAVSLATIGIFWSACGIIRLAVLGRDLNLLGLFAGVGTFGLVIFSGGLWTVLLLRQVAAAFWFTVLVPGAILVILAGLFGGESDEFMNGMIVSVLGVYSLAGFFFARWLFFRAQDVQWSGGDIVMPEVRGLARFKSKEALRIWRPRAALWRKEFQLHQAQFVMAFALLILHLGVLAVRKFYDLSQSRDLKFILESFWGLWLVMPLLVGCAAVAEERKLATHEGQLCLPAKRRTQFAIKLSVVLALALFFGLVMPLLLEGIRILPDLHLQLSTGLTTSEFGHLPWSQRTFWNVLGHVNTFLPLLILAGIVLLIAGISFYMSSLVRNTMQSFAPAALGIIVASWLILVAGVIPFARNIDYLWSGPLADFLCVPLVAATLVVLAFGNFKQSRPGWKTFGLNLLALVCALAFGASATAAIYHRAWEKLTPFEPAHGAAKLSLSPPVVLDDSWGVSVLLPDGKFWWVDYDYSPGGRNPFELLLGNVKTSLVGGGYFSGANWKSVVRLPFEFAGIKNDGSLWISEKPIQSESRTNRTNGQWQAALAGLRNLVRFGVETNWTSLARSGYSLLLVKDDGTLWNLGTNNFNFNRQQWPGLRTFVPRRMGTESNWADVVESGYPLVLHKTDGTGWTAAADWQTNDIQIVEVEPGFVVHAVPGRDRGKFRSTAQIWGGLGFMVGIQSNGTFRVWAEEYVNWGKKHSYGDWQWRPADLQIGDDTNWLAVAAGGEKLVTLKSDGSLWLWNFHRLQALPWDSPLRTSEIQATVPVRLGTHSDWVAIAGNWGSVVTLAADGSLWFWQLENASDYSGNYNNQISLRPLLEYSRKPHLLGNIFDAAN